MDVTDVTIPDACPAAFSFGLTLDDPRARLAQIAALAKRATLARIARDAERALTVKGLLARDTSLRAAVQHARELAASAGALANYLESIRTTLLRLDS